MNENIRSRSTLLASFYAASRRSTNNVGMIVNSASAAGIVLHLCKNARDAAKACETMPPDPVWTEAARYLRSLAEDEAPDTMPPVAVGGRR